MYNVTISEQSGEQVRSVDCQVPFNVSAAEQIPWYSKNDDMVRVFDCIKFGMLFYYSFKPSKDGSIVTHSVKPLDNLPDHWYFKLSFDIKWVK